VSPRLLSSRESARPSEQQTPWRSQDAWGLERELAAAELEQLKTALSILVGTEAFIATRYVVRLDYDRHAQAANGPSGK
jgi:hypothetical protein